MTDSKPITEQEQTESAFTPKIDWSQRHHDPHMRMKWNSAIEVIPANREKGEMTGTRIFPDQTRETFVVQ